MKKKDKKFIIGVGIGIAFVILIALLAFFFFLNKNVNSNSSNNSNMSSFIKNGEDSKVLVVYYSYSNTTEKVAKLIQEKTNADIYEIRTKEEYNPSQARGDREKGVVPEIVDDIPNIEQYDLIIAGSPIWGYTVSTTMMSFLDSVDFQGKFVAPFTTDIGKHGTYFQDFGEQAKNAKILQGLSLTNASSMTDEELNNKIDKWLEILYQEEASESYKISITINNTVIEGTLDNSETSQEFIRTLPRVMDMTNYSDREIYGSIGKSLSSNTVSSNIEDGDILYFIDRNYFALFYDINQNPNVSSRYVKIGSITSSLDVFNDFDNIVEAKIELVMD